MKLKTVRVQNFKSVEDSDEFTIDQVTCLVGKNEAGKTTLLEALGKLNPVEKTEANFDEEEFPRRHLSTYRERKERAAANVLTTTWELNDEDVRAVEGVLGKGTLASRTITIKKGYDNTQYWTVLIEEQKLGVCPANGFGAESLEHRRSLVSSE